MGSIKQPPSTTSQAADRFFFALKGEEAPAYMRGPCKKKKKPQEEIGEGEKKNHCNLNLPLFS